MNLRIIYQNVRGLRTKSDEFFSAVAGTQYDIIAATETGFNDKSMMAEYVLQTGRFVERIDVLLFRVEVEVEDGNCN